MALFDIFAGLLNVWLMYVLRSDLLLHSVHCIVTCYVAFGKHP